MKRKYKTCSVTSPKNQARYVGEKLPLYAKGNVVGVQLENDASYFGTDLMGSVRSVTDGYGSVKNLREYDVFGNPLEIAGYSNGLEYGYAGKPYDAVTEMYNYGFRDYLPATARFTTLDPIRDGTNWFSYVNNDPVNFVDLWGLMASDVKRGASSFNNANILHFNNMQDELLRGTINEFHRELDIREKLATQETEINTFVGLVRDLVGSPYSHNRLPDKSGVDCSGVIVYALNEMGYEVDKWLSVEKIISGTVAGIEILPYSDTNRQGDKGMLNFYQFAGDTTISHVNIGVGKNSSEKENQIIDASSQGTSWQADRNSQGERQIIPAEAGMVNQTWAPFSTRTSPVLQAVIDFSKLKKKEEEI